MAKRPQVTVPWLTRRPPCCPPHIRDTPLGPLLWLFPCLDHSACPSVPTSWSSLFKYLHKAFSLCHFPPPSSSFIFLHPVSPEDTLNTFCICQLGDARPGLTERLQVDDLQAQCLGVSLSCPAASPAQGHALSRAALPGNTPGKGARFPLSTGHWQVMLLLEFPAGVVEALSKLQPSSHFFLSPTLSPVFTVLIPDRHLFPKLHLSVCCWRTNPGTLMYFPQLECNLTEGRDLVLMCPQSLKYSPCHKTGNDWPELSEGRKEGRREGEKGPIWRLAHG